MKLMFTALAAVSLLFVCGCSDSTAPVEKKAAAPAAPVKGRSALYSMYNMARSWAPDAQVLQLHSIDLPDVKRERGKAAAWEAVFVSQQTGKRRSYTYSVVEAEGNLHKGVFAGLEESFSGSRAASPFLIAALKTDSDEVYQTALSKAADYEKKNPDKPIAFLLEKTEQFPDPAWRVIWGESVGTSNFSVFVDASTGKYLQTMR